MTCTASIQETVRPAERSRRPAARDTVVKSAGRALRILELFDRLRSPANAQTVACALGFPASSASALLRSLVASGYLHFDKRQRTYTPTVRVPLLGSGWVAPRLYAGSPLERTMERLRESCDATVIFAARNGDMAEDVLVLTAHGAPVLPGVGRRLTSPGIGQLLLSTLSDRDVRLLLHRLNAEACARGEAVLPPSHLLQDLGRIRSQGYAIGIDPLNGEAALVTVPLPLQELGGPFALALSVHREEAVQLGESLAQTMRREIVQHMGTPKPVLRWPEDALISHSMTNRRNGTAAATMLSRVAHAPA